MIDNDKSRWDFNSQIAKDEPGKEHTELLTVDMLKDNDKFVVYKYGEHEHCDTKGNLVCSFRDNDNNLMIARTKKQYHELVAAQSGAGKTQCVILNEAMSMDGKTSYVFLDPKGEITERAYSLAVEKYGKENVMVANFMKPEYSTVLIGPITEIAQKVAEASKKSKEAFNAALKIAETELTKFLEACFPTTSKKDPSWERIARVFLFSILFGLIEDMGLTDEEVEVYGRIRPLPSQINFATAEKILSVFEQERYFDDRGFFRNRPIDSVARQRSKMVADNAETTRRNYLAFVEEDVAMYNDPRIATMSSDNTFDIKKMGHTPSVLFLLYDISDPRMREWVNCIFAYEMSNLLAYSHELGEPLPIPVRFIADEFPTLKAHDIYPNILATGRGTNLFMTICVQSLSQLEARYPTEWKTMTENCGIKVFLGTSDCKTAEQFVNDLGRTTIPSAGCFLSGQYQSETVPVVTFDKLLHGMEWGESYICLDRSMPIHGQFEMYYKTPEFLQYPIVKNTEHKIDTQTLKKIDYDAPWFYRKFDDIEDDDLFPTLPSFDSSDSDENDDDVDDEDNDELDDLLFEDDKDDMDEITDEALRREKAKEILSGHRKEDETDEQWEERLNRMIDWFEKIAKEIKNETNPSFEVWFIRGSEAFKISACKALCRHKGVSIAEAKSIFEAKKSCLIKGNLSKDNARNIVQELKENRIFATIISTNDYFKEFEYEDDEDNEAFENVCMNVIEDITRKDPEQTRKDAIAIAEIILDHAKENCSERTVAVWERVMNEFMTATDEEYELLRKMVFDE